MTKIYDADLPRVVEVYQTAVRIGQSHRAVQVVAEAFGVNRSTAHRWLNKAIEAGMLKRLTGEHQPRRARWTDGGGAWSACAACRTPWPCAEADV